MMSRHTFVIALLLAILSLHLLGHNDQSEVKHDFFSHVMPLIWELLLYNANGIINGTIVFMG